MIFTRFHIYIYSLIYFFTIVFYLPSEIEPQNAFGIERFMIIRHIRLDRSHFSIFTSLEVSGVEMGHSVLSAKSKSIQPRTISTTSFHTLKFVPFRIRHGGWWWGWWFGIWLRCSLRHWHLSFFLCSLLNVLSIVEADGSTSHTADEDVQIFALVLINSATELSGDEIGGEPILAK